MISKQVDKNIFIVSIGNTSVFCILSHIKCSLKRPGMEVGNEKISKYSLK